MKSLQQFIHQIIVLIFSKNTHTFLQTPFTAHTYNHIMIERKLYHNYKNNICILRFSMIFYNFHLV